MLFDLFIRRIPITRARIPRPNIRAAVKKYPMVVHVLCESWMCINLGIPETVVRKPGMVIAAPKTIKKMPKAFFMMAI
jgi:hypothetical protein